MTADVGPGLLHVVLCLEARGRVALRRRWVRPARLAGRARAWTGWWSTRAVVIAIDLGGVLGRRPVRVLRVDEPAVPWHEHKAWRWAKDPQRADGRAAMRNTHPQLGPEEQYGLRARPRSSKYCIPPGQQRDSSKGHRRRTRQRRILCGRAIEEDGTSDGTTCLFQRSRVLGNRRRPLAHNGTPVAMFRRNTS
jgi:hypothetical protein